MVGIFYPCGDPCVSFTDASRHTRECLRCLALANEPWTAEDEARAEQAHRPIITTPRKAEQ